MLNYLANGRECGLELDWTVCDWSTRLRSTQFHPKERFRETLIEIWRTDVGWNLSASVMDAIDLVVKATSPKPLTENERAVLDIIKAQPRGRGITGKQIINELSESKQGPTMEQATLTKHIIPKLKLWYNVDNRPRVGYFIASD